MKKVSLFLVSAMLLTAGFMSCEKSDKSGDGTARLQVYLTDDPAQYEKVLIDVQKIEIHSDVDGWVSFNLLKPGIYNLLDFTNGLDTLIADVTLPAGKISQMRLILGSNNSVVIDGVSHPLATPSAQQSGLKFNIHQDLQVNGSYRVWIDFDAARSIVVQGNGNYSLKPVIKTYTELTDGRIKGIVLPLTAKPVVYAINNTDTSAAIPNAAGFYLFSGLPEGTYKIWIDADATAGFNDAVIENVTVSFGVVTDVGITTLIP